MTERSYTVAEIDKLRSACKLRWLYGTSNLAVATSSRSYEERDLSIGVEEMVRTHMLAGHTADDIYRADGRALAAKEG